MMQLFGKSALAAALLFVSWANAFNVTAGWLGLGIYVSTYGIKLWGNLFEACKEVRLSTQVTWKGTNCVAHAIFYVVGAATSFGVGGTGSEYISDGGVTTFGKRADGSAVTLPAWNWTHIHAHPDGLHQMLGSRLPGDVHSLHYNASDIGLDNSITIVKNDDQNMYIHTTNLTHGLVSMVQNATQQHRDMVKRDGYSWSFGNLAGLKYSYSNPGCESENIKDTHFDDYLGEVSWNAARWIDNNPADKYSLSLANNDHYGSPYVGGYLIAESNGFGHNYEGSPVLHDCFE